MQTTGELTLMLSQASTVSNECANPISAIVSQVGVEFKSFTTILRCYTYITQVGVADAGNTITHEDTCWNQT